MAEYVLDGVVTQKREILHDPEALRKWLPQLAEAIGMKTVGPPVMQPYSHWENGAPSAVQFIEESAIVVHCYPEVDYIEITLHSCKEIPDPQSLTCNLCELLGLKVRHFRLDTVRNWRELVKGPPKRTWRWPEYVWSASQD